MKIVVIEALGLSTAYLGCYGNDWVATPNLDRLAAEGVVFDWHIADQPELTRDLAWHERNVAWGSLSRANVGVPLFSPSVVRCASVTTFARDAVNAIAKPFECLWIEGPSLLPPWNFDADVLDVYFDEDDTAEELTPWPDPPMVCATLEDAEVVALQNTYAAVVTLFDAQLGIVLDRLRDAKDTLVCVTASAGMPLGEHGMIGAPLPSVHAELVHVPLIMRMPGGVEAGLRIDALTQPIDLTATCLEASHTPLPAMHGRSLWPLLRGEASQIRPYAVSSLGPTGAEHWLLRSPDWAFHLPPQCAKGETPIKPALFVKPDDRWEVNDLYQHHPDRADDFERVLRALIASLDQPDAQALPPIDFV